MLVILVILRSTLSQRLVVVDRMVKFSINSLFGNFSPVGRNCTRVVVKENGKWKTTRMGVGCCYGCREKSRLVLFIKGATILDSKLSA